MNLKEIRTDKAPLPAGPYSQAVKAGNLMFISGILPIDMETKKIVEPTVDAAKKIFSHLDYILQEAGLTRGNIVKTSIFMRDLKQFADVNKLYAEYFSDTKPFPARSTIEVSNLPMNAQIEMDFIAVI
ncbi:MAG: Rid family detoxifying hydrolase [Proteobacteria bacterium]|nr:Rid family detoxifying hydrolase [Pseudomonadota bacterium]